MLRLEGKMSEIELLSNARLLIERLNAKERETWHELR